MILDEIFSAPIKLSSNNFTSLSETPWAGDVINQKFKSNLKNKAKIGESWEFSCDSEKPSLLLPSKIKLSDLAIKTTKGFPLDKKRSIDLLVKLLCSEQNLSIQVHPNYGDKNLSTQECGKHESWLVLEAKENSGFYLGFKEGVTKEEILQAIRNEKDLSILLNFIPAKKGEYYDIPPGTVHAIGKGMTVLEPQRVTLGKKGKTFRLWDWNKKYTEKGTLDANRGKLRPLHIKECLELIETEKQSTSHIAFLRKEPHIKEKGNFGSWQVFPTNPYYQLHLLKLKKEAQIKISLKGSFLSFINLEGNGYFIKEGESKTLVEQGDSYLLAQKACPILLTASKELTAALTVPTPYSLSLETET